MCVQQILQIVNIINYKYYKLQILQITNIINMKLLTFFPTYLTNLESTNDNIVNDKKNFKFSCENHKIKTKTLYLKHKTYLCT
jgi:hypothetical protein